MGFWTSIGVNVRCHRRIGKMCSPRASEIESCRERGIEGGPEIATAEERGSKISRRAIGSLYVRRSAGLVR